MRCSAIFGTALSTRTLSQWLTWIESIHAHEIELGLERVRIVLAAMDLSRPPFTAVVVGGTNGKGSTVAMIEACLRQAGYRVGSYTSPHLIRYNERVRIDGREASDEQLCAAFGRVERARGPTALTYFEFGTVAALDLLRAQAVEIAVLEVGLGGRLDAVNAIDAEVAVVTSIGIDHTAWLGPDRESIGREKAGIFRAGRPAISGDPAPPASLATAAAGIGARLLQLNRDFSAEPADNGWVWRFGSQLRAGLPFPALRGDYQLRNAACALTALACIGDRFPLTSAQLRAGLLYAVIPGRMQVLPGLPLRVLDVAHNPDAARELATMLKRQFVSGKTHAVFGILKDKDMAGVVRELAEVADRWYVATLNSARAASAAEIQGVLAAAGVRAPVQAYADIRAAYRDACRTAAKDDRILVFGSFYAVGDILSISD